MFVSNNGYKSPKSMQVQETEEALEALVEKLVTSSYKKSSQAENSSPSSSQDKQFSMSNYDLRSSPKRNGSFGSGTSLKGQSPYSGRKSVEWLDEALNEKLFASPPTKIARTESPDQQSCYYLRSSPNSKRDAALENGVLRRVQSPLRGHKSPSKLFKISSFYDDQSDQKSLEILKAKLFPSFTNEKSAKAENSSPSSSNNKQSSILNYCHRSQDLISNVSSRSGTSRTVQTRTTKREGKTLRGGCGKKETPKKVSNNGKVNNTNLDGWLSKDKNKSIENNIVTEKVKGKVKNKKKVLVENSNNNKTAKQRENKKLGGGCGKKEEPKKVSNGKTNLDGWLSKNRNKSTENNIITENVKGKVKNKKEVLVETPKNNKTAVKKSRTIKREASGSFAKYGMCIPSFEDIVAYQKKFKDEKQCVDSVNILEDSQELLDLRINEPAEPTVILDCKHLSGSEIKDAYKSNFQYVYEIFHGTRYSARHELFKKQNYKDDFTLKDLKYNTSMTSFTHEQKQQLLRRLHKKFDNDEDLPANNQYFVKVLLPELCLKIFMDVHNMSRDEATTYLENRPIALI